MLSQARMFDKLLCAEDFIQDAVNAKLFREEYRDKLKISKVKIEDL